MSKNRILTAVHDEPEATPIDTILGVAESSDNPAVQAAVADLRASVAALDTALAVDAVQRLEAQLAEARARLPRRATAPKKAGRPKRKVSGRNPAPAQIRAWALGRGLDVGARGRISADLREQYAEAVSA